MRKTWRVRRTKMPLHGSHNPASVPAICCASARAADPAQAVYKGRDIERAESFRCEMPRHDDRTIVEPGDLIHIRNALTQRDLRLPNR